MPREFDLIIYGATGFTGRRAVKYIAERAPPGVRWAIAGRDLTRLQALGSSAPAIAADAKDRASLNVLIGRAQVLLNFAGPFRRYGDPLIDACIAQQTHYADISGETARIRDLIDRCHRDAEQARVKVVPFCGVSSTPADLGVQLLDRMLDGKLSLAKGAIAITSGFLNGGTVASIADAIESGDAARERDPFLLGPHGRRPSPLEQDPKGVRFDKDLASWVVASPMGLSDTRAVRRSADLAGRDIVFQEYSGFPSLPAAAGMAATLGLMNAAFGMRATRRWIASKVLPGQGPSEAQIEGGAYSLRLWGRSEEGREARVSVKGVGDPGNRITVTCACEAALALVSGGERLPDRCGVVTPSIAVGEVLIERLNAAGLTFQRGQQELSRVCEVEAG